MDLKKYALRLIVGLVIKKLKKGGAMKNGFKTTEFWFSVISVVLSIWMAVQGLLPAEYVAGIIGIVTAAYTIARAIVKMTPSTKDDELLAKIDELLKKSGGA